MLVASHNIMHGLRLPELARDYQDLRDQEGLDLLCIQENRTDGPELAAEQIAAALGDGYRGLWDPEHDQVGMVFDGDRHRVLAQDSLPLPRTENVSWIDRTYLRGGVVTRRWAQLVTFERRADGLQFTAVNFHLQTAGGGRVGTEMRRRQIQTIADELVRRQLAHRIIACGDTNGFDWRSRRQLGTLAHIMEPLARHDAGDPGSAPTHFFARQNEPKLTHRIAVGLGRLGLDLPMRYDVICTNLAVDRRGQVETPASDHDLVWARVAL